MKDFELDFDSLEASYNEAKEASKSKKYYHGENGSSYCSDYCTTCIRNGAYYVTKNSFIREFFVSIPIVGGIFYDNGFKLANEFKALPNPSSVVKTEIEEMVQIPLKEMTMGMNSQIKNIFNQQLRGA